MTTCLVKIFIDKDTLKNDCSTVQTFAINISITSITYLHTDTYMYIMYIYTYIYYIHVYITYIFACVHACVCKEYCLENMYISLACTLLKHLNV